MTPQRDRPDGMTPLLRLRNRRPGQVECHSLSVWRAGA